MNSLTVPIIVSDVDGVLKQHRNALPKAAQTIRVLRKPLKELDPVRFSNSNINDRLPFLLLTNRGSITESAHAKLVNKAFSFDEEHDSNMKFTEGDQILNHTALRHLWFTEQFKDKLLLFVGQDAHLIAEDAGIKYITVDEYLDLYPEIFPHFRNSLNTRSDMIEKLKVRLQIEDSSVFDEGYLQVHGIFIVQFPNGWECSNQLIMDFLSTEDGKFAKSLPFKCPASHIPVFCSMNDLMYKDDFQLPRLLNKMFITTLKDTFKELYGGDLKVQFFGKPERSQFDFALNHAKKQLPSNHLLSNVYMIGDNPTTDIRGANEAGWTSILVRTGVFKGDGNDTTYPASHVVDDIEEAIKLIFQLEGINYNGPWSIDANQAS